MGYETRLLIGRSTTPHKGVKKGDYFLDEYNNLDREYIKGEDGEFIYTDRMESYFMIYATIDLCKVGCLLPNELRFNTNPDKHVNYWYEGGKECMEDSYGKYPSVVKLNVVLDAIKELQEENGDEPYRRFDWAIALLESMSKGKEELEVLLVGY